jgi:hypothetical protein
MATATKSSKAAAKSGTKNVTMVKLSSVYASQAAKRNIDTTRAAKLVRSRLRGNFAKVCELSPNIAQVKTSSNDGNRWPAEITKELADFLTS